MNLRHKMQFLPMLALAVTLAMVAPTQARASDVSLQVRFGSTPHWVGVPGTQVRYIRQGDRTDYDVFRYGHRYYLYNNADSRWYMSRRERGRYFMIDDRAVPGDLRRVPRDNWRNYPATWEDRNGRARVRDRNWNDRSGGRYGNDGSQGANGRLRVTFGTTPQWSSVRGTRVETISGADRPGFDVFRFNNTYYAYDNSRWYSSSDATGDFIMIDDRSVPTELSRVPRDQWRDYPSTWQGQDDRDHDRGR